MNRLISVLVTLFILFLVYLWINHITQRDEDPVHERTEHSEDITQKTETAPIEESPTQVETEVQSAPVETETPEPSKEVEESPPPPRKRGGHMVIAGNFLERANAEKHLRAISELGFTEAEILEFEISEYYTVCAGRYNDLSDARNAVRRIKELPGMDAYVRNSN